MALTTTEDLTTSGDLIAGGTGDLITYGIMVGGGFLFFIIAVAFLAKLYRRASKETAFVRTGLGGEKV
ncbi:MAG: hypothetical protein U1D66_00400, partial [Erythrobacter sp.]|nr:hypothetical protein [Erythrobacter sp.]